MDLDEFVTWWSVRDRAELARAIERVRGTAGTSHFAVDRARVRVASAAALRRAAGIHDGCRAAHRCRVAAFAACERTGLAVEDRSGAILLARVAGEAGGALAAGLSGAAVRELLEPLVLPPLAA